MNLPQKVYIALGSNQGDKFKHLQNAIDSIHIKTGNIISISKVYKTKAMGFKGGDFFNACIGIETELTPSKLLQELLQIEKAMGRIRTKTKNFEDRIIDIDIIFTQRV